MNDDLAALGLRGTVWDQMQQGRVELGIGRLGSRRHAPGRHGQPYNAPVRTTERLSGRLRDGGPARALRAAVAATVLYHEAGDSSEAPVGGTASEASVEAFVDGRFSLMAPHVRIGVAAIEALLVLRCLAATGHGPAGLSHAATARLVRTWESSRFGPVADYVRLVRSLAVLAAFDASAVGPSP